jgi:DNA (cytosine-5)-methyltransferase 3A
MARINVLSLFDGMSCGQQALERAGIKVTNYFASEIDKHAIKVTMANYPNTIQLGSVVDVDGYSLPKIDLLIGGSPCQSFSFAGKRKGMSTKCETEILTLEHYLQLKSEGYEFEGQSYLFWEYMRLLNECKPKYFLLENVEMGEKWERVLSKAIGINGIHINSALVSAQNRKRIYWTNIGHEPGGLFGDLVCKIEQPKDRGILLKDILESEVDDKYYLSEKAINYINRNERNLSFQMNENDNKSGCVVARYQSGIPYNQIVVHNTMPRSSTSGKGGTGHLSRNDGKTYCLDTGNTNAVEIVGLTEVRTQEAKQIRKETGTNPKRAKELVERTDGKIGALLTSQTADNLVFSYRQDAPNDVNGKKDCLRANAGGVLRGVGIIENTSRIRRLTPLECERLQTVADGYTAHVSDSQRYKMLGNGWTVDVIVHIFNYIK